MALKPLDVVGDSGTLNWCNTGTLSAGGAACGTLTGGTLTGVIGDGIIASGTLTALAGIYDITPNSVKPKKVETTKLGSLAATSQPGTPDYGEVKVTLAQNGTMTSLINSWIANKTLNFFKVTINDADTPSAMTFLGWIADWTPLAKELKKDETAKSDLMIQITGVPLQVCGT